MAYITAAKSKDASAILAREFAGRKFQVYSIVTDLGLGNITTFNKAYAELERIMYASGGAANGIDIREVK